MARVTTDSMLRVLATVLGHGAHNTRAAVRPSPPDHAGAWTVQRHVESHRQARCRRRAERAWAWLFLGRANGKWVAATLRGAAVVTRKARQRAALILAMAGRLFGILQRPRTPALAPAAPEATETEFQALA